MDANHTTVGSETPDRYRDETRDEFFGPMGASAGKSGPKAVPAANHAGEEWWDALFETRYLTPDRREHRTQRSGRAAVRPRAPQVPSPARAGDDDGIGDGGEERMASRACSENEQAWLQANLGVFHRDSLIVDVLGRVKGGKEANVYCCRAHPSTGLELIAAKIYRPRAHRTMRNDAIYREGRLALDEQGKGIVRDARVARAMARKTAYGVELLTFGWIEHEHEVMRRLSDAGADVPRPVAHVGAAILMEYLGDPVRPAPTLDGVRFASRAHAHEVFERLMWHVELMLEHGWVHGDLSAYNVLVDRGRAVVIDFPQTVLAARNANADRLLHRDVARVCSYFERYGLRADAPGIAADLWARYASGLL